MDGEIMTTGQIILALINILMTLVGVLVAFQVKRLYQSVDALSGKDTQLEQQITAHREDVLRNYSSTNELAAVRDEVFKRFDRFEDTIMGAIRRIPGP